MDDHAASLYGGGRNKNKSSEIRYKIVVRKIQGNKRRIVQRRLVRNSSATVRRLGKGIFSARYKAVIRKRTTNKPKSKTTVKTNASTANSFNF